MATDCGLIRKIGALISTMSITVLGSGVIVMFGMVAAGMLADVNWNRRKMVIFAISLWIGLGLQLEYRLCSIWAAPRRSC